MSILGGSWLPSLRAHAALPGVPPFAFASLAALSGGRRPALRDGRRTVAVDGTRGGVPESAELRGLRAELRELETELRAFGADAGTDAARTGVDERSGATDGAAP